MSEIRYSIVVPVYNEEKNIALLYEKLVQVMGAESYEVIFVDDGSRDNTFKELEALASKDDRVRAVSFSRNFGHQIALTAGYDLAEGQAVICLDGDLQHPPELIPEMIEKWKQGFDIVLTIREDSDDTTFFKRVTSRLFYKIINKLAKIEIKPGCADFRLMDRKVLDTLNTFRERSRFLRGIISWMGYRCAYINYKANERVFGKSKYSLAKMVKFAVDGVLSFSSYPLKLSSIFGYTISGFAFIYIVYALFAKLYFNAAISGWASLLIAILLLGGVQLICIGIIGEYLSRIYDETKNRPLYIVDKKLGYKEHKEEKNRERLL
ncbi:MAG: glycosyltransferase family 2 protein [Clostridiales bacterium]|nr:glycosyltransferase family 2 protein [Eubacteriales bacterium]MDH7567151.1 glycosyltransferase family 2 protein [Clostridiales bacterium]